MQTADQNNTYLDGSLGIFTMVALILLLWGMCWLRGYAPFQKKQYVNVMFNDVAGLRSGCAVFIDGVHAGYVDSVNWTGPHRVLVRLSITNNHMTVIKGSQVNILANAVIGARYVEITLPDTNTSDQESIDESTVIAGGYVLRPELILHKVGEDINKIDIDAVQRSLSEDGQVLKHAANQFSTLADKAIPVMDRALPLADSLTMTSNDLRRTANSLNKFMDSPKLSPEVKNTINELHETAQIAQRTVTQLNSTLTDKPLRQDLLDTMHQLNQSSNQLEQAMAGLQRVTDNTQFRTDIKEILLEARKALEKLDAILNEPESDSNLKATLKNTRGVLTDIDIAARQIQQVLDKQAPIIHLFIGRPGHLKE